MPRTRLAALLAPTLALVLLPGAAIAGQIAWQSGQPYAQPSDASNLFGGPVETLIDFEDGRALPPGLRLSPGQISTPGPDSDSVDSDDGLLDGLGSAGHSYRVASGEAGLSVHFDAVALGGLPTQVGLVWTDGSPHSAAFLEAFGPAGQSYGWVGAEPIGDDDLLGSTTDDWFFGVDTFGLAAIASVRLWTVPGPRGDAPMEVDHLQFGGLTEWLDVGQAVAGTLDEPALTGQGLLLPDAPATVTVDQLPIGTLGFLIVGSESIPTPLFGGVLVPAPEVVLPFQVGRDSLAWTTTFRWPADLLDLTPLYLQAWMQDAAAPRGWSASNALQVGVGD